MLAAAAFLTALAPAKAWDPAGHMLVGQIAWEKTSPKARERVTALVKQLDTTYHEGQPYNFVTANCWMDDMRSAPGYAWSKLHYVTVYWTPTGEPFQLPKPPHVVSAIEDSINTLKDSGTPPAKAVEAVAMLVHFVGDVHQPLHATDRHDRGGNGVLIAGVSFSDLYPGTVANLHAFWDKAFRFDSGGDKIVEAWRCPPVAGRPKAPGDGVIAKEAAKIASKYPEASFPELATNTTAESWARESHVLGCKFAYPPGAEPSDHQAVSLTPEYAHTSREIAEKRVALAGYRLARVLNQLFEK